MAYFIYIQNQKTTPGVGPVCGFKKEQINYCCQEIMFSTLPVKIFTKCSGKWPFQVTSIILVCNCVASVYLEIEPFLWFFNFRARR